jgi:hypothetical protein
MFWFIQKKNGIGSLNFVENSNETEANKAFSSIREYGIKHLNLKINYSYSHEKRERTSYSKSRFIKSLCRKTLKRGWEMSL